MIKATVLKIRPEYTAGRSLGERTRRESTSVIVALKRDEREYILNTRGGLEFAGELIQPMKNKVYFFSRRH